MGTLSILLSTVSDLTVPLILTLCGAAVLFSQNRSLFDEFILGAKEGLMTSVHLLPVLIALVTAVSMFSASGAGEFIAGILTPVCDKIGLPAELIPFISIRPVSGGASIALLQDILTRYGADSFTGRCASVIMGSSDTIVYIIAVYFSAVGIKKTGHAIPAAFMTMIFSVFFAAFVSRIFFG